MSNKKFIISAVVAAALVSLGVSAQAATYNIDLSGPSLVQPDVLSPPISGPWQAAATYGDYGNSYVEVSLPAGATVTGFSFTNLVFSTNGSSADPKSSQLSDLVLSVNSIDPSYPAGSAWLDWKPVGVAFEYGTSAPLSGSWNDNSGLPGAYGKGSPFVTLAGLPLFITTYLSFNPANGISISSGTLSINYDIAAVPEPGTYALMGLGLLGMAAVSRRRRAA